MSTRKILSLTFAAALLSAPIAATAVAATGASHPPVHHTSKPVRHARTNRPAAHNSGDAAVNALNDQSLARARGATQ